MKYRDDDLLPNRAGDAERQLRAARAGMTGVPCPKPKSRKKKVSGWAPKRRTRLKSRGKRTKKSGGSLFPKRRDPAYCDWVRRQPCLLSERQRADWKPGMEWMHICFTAVRQVCHVNSRGAGGDDRKNVVSMCPRAHAEQHRIGTRSFEKRWNVNLTDAAVRLYADYWIELHEPRGVPVSHPQEPKEPN